MKRPQAASYREAVEIVALNESSGDDDCLPKGITRLQHIASLVSVAIVADIYQVTPEKFARAIIRFRNKNMKTEGRSLQAATRFLREKLEAIQTENPQNIKGETHGK